MIKLRRLIIPVCLAVTIMAVSAEEHRSWTITPVPLAGYAPDYGVIFAAAAIVVYGIPEGETSGNVLITNVMGTTKGAFLSVIGIKHFINDRRIRADGTVAASFFPRTFYGVGPTADDEEAFRSRNISADACVAFRMGNAGYLGPAFEAYSFRVAEAEEESALAGAHDVHTGAGFAYTLDTTDESFSPRSGVKVDGSVTAFSDFVDAEVDARLYHPWDSIASGALQTRLHGVLGDAPLHRLPSVGGDGILRGYGTGRWRDDVAVSSQYEIRIPVYGRFGAALFAGAGTVGSTWSELRAAPINTAGGFGIRVTISESQRLNFRTDFAWGSEGMAVYVNARESF